MIILCDTQYYNKIEIRKYTNIKYDDICWYFLNMYNPIYLGILF